MLLAGLILAATAAAPPLSSDVEVSDAVIALSVRYGRDFPPEALKELEALQVAGDRTAAALLGELYMLTARGCDYSEKAGRHASALHNLATCYFLGKGRPRDPVKARALYGQASEIGFAKAACAFGNMLIEGQGGDADVARGLDLCRQAADAGEPDAQTDYGGYLLTNRHMPKDAVRARHYLRLAADRKQANAAFLLGHIYWNGDGIEQDRVKAAQWWTIAHEGGRRDAAHHIGREAIGRLRAAHDQGKPISDAILEDAEKWMRIAAETDPDPGKRANATQQLGTIAALRSARRHKGERQPN
ncbi:MAG: tetratricopeptide repeat protein [Allosphingosinicella sp.]